MNRDELSIQEKNILEKIEMIHGVLMMAKNKGEVSEEFFIDFKHRLNELINLCEKKFSGGDIR